MGKDLGGHLDVVCSSSAHSSVHSEVVKTIVKIKFLSMGSEFLDIAGTGGCGGRKHQQAQKGLDKFQWVLKGCPLRRLRFCNSGCWGRTGGLAHR